MSLNPDSTNQPRHLPMAGAGKESSGWTFGDAVIVTIDLEIHCRNQTWKEFQAGIRGQHRVTEIGMARFDPRSVNRDSAGDRGVQAWSSISASNLCIIEHKHVVNGRTSHAPHCRLGNADNFEFGKPKWIHLNEARNRVMSEIHRLVGKNRKVVFQFFDQHNDLKWLEGLGINLQNLPNSTIEDIQVGPIASLIARRLWKPKIRAEELYQHLRFQPSNLHNGGNDAVWELRAFIAGDCLIKDGLVYIPDDAFPLGKDGQVLNEAPVQIDAGNDSEWEL